MHQSLSRASGRSLLNPGRTIWDFPVTAEFQVYLPHPTFLLIKAAGHQVYGVQEEEVKKQEKQLKELKRCGYCLCRWKEDTNRNTGLEKPATAMKRTFQIVFPWEHSPEDSLTEPAETHVRLLTSRM